MENKKKVLKMGELCKSTQTDIRKLGHDMNWPWLTDGRGISVTATINIFEKVGNRLLGLSSALRVGRGRFAKSHGLKEDEI